MPVGAAELLTGDEEHCLTEMKIHIISLNEQSFMSEFKTFFSRECKIIKVFIFSLFFRFCLVKGEIGLELLAFLFVLGKLKINSWRPCAYDYLNETWVKIPNILELIELAREFL